ncbi:MAG: acylphosphatase [Bacteroidia bacterium]|nr:acylphosphatase [Bacteroidia bacterium]
MKKHYQIRVNGIVQGVGFRAYARAEAFRLGVVGLVRNENDGAVYIEAEAEEEVLMQFLGACRQGPPQAEVREVDYQEQPLKNYPDFDIAY